MAKDEAATIAAGPGGDEALRKQHYKLNREINAALADPNMKARLADVGGDVLALSPADFGKLIAAETEKWGKVVKFAGLKGE